MAVDGVIYATRLGDSLSTGAEGRRRVGGGWFDGGGAAERVQSGRLLERRIFMPGVMRNSVSVDGN